jgi:hypothetical protein
MNKTEPIIIYCNNISVYSVKNDIFLKSPGGLAHPPDTSPPCSSDGQQSKRKRVNGTAADSLLGRCLRRASTRQFARAGTSTSGAAAGTTGNVTRVDGGRIN